MRGLLIAGVAALAMAGHALAGEWKKLLEPADLAALTHPPVVLVTACNAASGPLRRGEDAAAEIR